MQKWYSAYSVIISSFLCVKCNPSVIHMHTIRLLNWILIVLIFPLFIKLCFILGWLDEYACLPESMYVHHSVQVPGEASRGRQIPELRLSWAVQCGCWELHLFSARAAKTAGPCPQLLKCVPFQRIDFEEMRHVSCLFDSYALWFGTPDETGSQLRVHCIFTWIISRVRVSFHMLS